MSRSMYRDDYEKQLNALITDLQSALNDIEKWGEWRIEHYGKEIALITKRFVNSDIRPREVAR